MITHVKHVHVQQHAHLAFTVGLDAVQAACQCDLQGGALCLSRRDSAHGQAQQGGVTHGLRLAVRDMEQVTACHFECSTAQVEQATGAVKRARDRAGVGLGVVGSPTGVGVVQVIRQLGNVAFQNALAHWQGHIQTECMTRCQAAIAGLHGQGVSAQL